jgi:CTP:phosphocholine cytidylyltransferase-like protein
LVSFIMHLMSLSSGIQYRVVSLGHLQGFRLDSILNNCYLRNSDHYVTRKLFKKNAYTFKIISVKLHRDQPKW